MSNAAKRGLKAAANDKNVNPGLILLAERIADRQIVVADDIGILSEVMARCIAAKNVGWTGTLPWIEWQLAGGDSGEKWILRRMEELAPETRKAIADINFTPPDSVQKAAAMGLGLRREFNRGGTSIGVARARDLSNGTSISPSTARRMKAYFDRHEVDKKGQGWSDGEAGYPSAGHIAWLLWGGDPGRSWANSLVEQMNAGGERAANLPAEYPNDDDNAIPTSYEGTDMTERDMALCRSYRDIGDEMGAWDDNDCHYLDEKTGMIMCRKQNMDAGKTAMGAMDNMNSAPSEGEKRSEPVVTEPEATTPPAQTQRQREDAEINASIAALDAIVLETYLHGDETVR
jgi:hypothetical protein